MKSYNHRFLFCLVVTVAMIAVMPAIAVPNLVNFQGTLADSDGNPISGASIIVFSMYPSAAATTALWQETQTVQVIDGLYVVQLGSVTSFQESLFGEPELWIGLKVGTDDEQTPRIRIISVPYALAAKTAEKAAVAETVSDGAITNLDLQPGAFSNITGVGELDELTVAAGDVNIDTTSTGEGRLRLRAPVAGGEADVSLWRGAASDDGFLNVERHGADYTILQVLAPPDDPKESTLSLTRNFDGGTEFLDLFNLNYPPDADSMVMGIKVQSRGTGVLRDFAFQYNDGSGTYDVMRLKPSGNVGIGTADPRHKLEVNGIISVNNPEGTGFVITNRGATTNFNGLQLSTAGAITWSIGSRSDGTDDFHVYDDTNNDTRFLIEQSSGNVGIGTTSPTAKLDVNGSVAATSFVGDGSALMNLSVDASEIVNGSVTKEKLDPAISGVPVGGMVLSESGSDPGLIANGYERVAEIQVEAKGVWTSMNTENAPVTGGSSVWTGTELIVWGGVNPNNPDQSTDTGAIYNLENDAWRPTSTLNTPASRTSHTAVWTGSKMIVWGGYTKQPSSSSLTNSGGIYDPQTDIWSSISTTNAPAPRIEHSVVWAGSKMIVWGGVTGLSSEATRTNTGGVYDPIHDSWQPTSLAGVPSPRKFHTAISTGSTMIIWGDGDSIVYIYDPDSDSWMSLSASNAPSVRNGHVSVWTGTEMIMWGGRTGGPALLSGGIFDPRTNRWKSTSLLNTPEYRYQHAGVWTGTQLIIWGGYGLIGTLDNGGIYDPATDKWKAISADGSPSPRNLPSVFWTGSKMIVWGGHGLDESDGPADDSAWLNTGGIYDPVKDRQDYFIYIKR